MKCQRDSDGRALDHHTLQTLRMQAVKAARKGMPVAAIAEAMRGRAQRVPLAGELRLGRTAGAAGQADTTLLS